MFPFAILLDKVVVSVEVSADDQHYMKIHYLNYDFGDKVLYLEAVGDCCSETWFADIVGINNLLTGSVYDKVIGIEILRFPEEVSDARGRQDVDEVYGVRLRTCKGDCDIIYRNSSNGYYGGTVEVASEAACVGIEFEKITKDWQSSAIPDSS